jgi:lysophospholipase L1-like esterase
VEIYQPDARLFWRLKPNQDCFTKVDHRPVRINSRGTRGPEFAVPKPPNTVRILSLGDSKTFGWGLSEDETYSARLQMLLQERLGPERHVEVINAGVNAWSYAQMKVFLEHDGLAFQPDFVLLADANLWTQFSEDSDPEFVRQMLSRVRLKNLLRRSAIYHFVIEVQLNNFYQRYRTKFIPVDPRQDTLFKDAQKADPDEMFRRTIEATCTLASTAGAKPVVIFIPILTDLQASQEISIQKVKRDLCQRLGVPFLDLTADLKTDPEIHYLPADPVHLNAAGNDRVARRLTDVFADLIKQPAPAGRTLSASD